MSEPETATDLENKDIDLKKAMQYEKQKKTNVYLTSEGNGIEIISDSYEELLQAQSLFQQNTTGKANKRARRTFIKT